MKELQIEMAGREFFLLLTLILSTSYYVKADCSFKDLINSIKNDSNIPDNKVRPVQNWRNTTVVKIDFALYTIVSLDSSLQSLITYVWFTMKWKNEFLSWDPDKFCGIKHIVIPGGSIWVPDFYIYEMTKTEDKAPVIPYYTVHYDGNITSGRPLRVVSTCNLDVFKFPFDIQTCNFTFGPYVHTVEEMIMEPISSPDEAYRNMGLIFMSKGDWYPQDINIFQSTIKSGGAEYSKVTYAITIQRSSGVLVINLIVPACLLVLLDIVSMFIELETNERLGFKITVVLGFSVLLLILNNMLPNSNQPPILGIFCCVCLSIMIVSLMASIGTSYMLMLSEKEPKVPPWINLLVLKTLARILCFKPIPEEEEEVTTREDGSDGTDGTDGITNRRAERSMSFLGEKDGKSSPEVKILKKMLLEVLKIHKVLNNSKEEAEVKSEWKRAALVVDRLILVLYLVFGTIMFTIVTVIWVTGAHALD